ncbi:hypothetical protein BegalDRAFT_1933 [Beggiatoa alba B18LD]|uniref:DUF8196 domain-containing protein n=1 Tax=Beggiatoa alba B18LD TaxID=395493 RepID=I3CGR2_9GAMM|nr:hypothetical protein [Beggiatoa alba]EIJ42805.1 hypothetical protein BegalDRAFT_1933 [Beggiatoa alba B18LD]
MFEKEFESLLKSLTELRESQRQTDAQMKQTDERLDRLCKQVGGISNNNGDVAEEFFWNALKDKKELNGIKLDYSDKNVHRRKGNTEDEFDILLWNGSAVIIVETKYKVHPNHLSALKEKKIPNFRKLFPDKNDHKIYAAIAGFSIPDELVDEAKESGFFVFKQSGDNLLIENADNIQAF